MANEVIISFIGKDGLTSVVNKATESVSNVGKAAEQSASKFNGFQEIARGVFQKIGHFAIDAAANIGSSVVSGMTGFFKDAINDATSYQNVLKQTESVIASTGGTAGFTVSEMEELARSMSATEGMSLFSDDAILSAQNVLATFTGIQGAEFGGATQAIVNMSQALGTDLQSSALQVGKALNDPIAGLSALSRAGVSFSEEQKEVIKGLVETSDVAGAQRVMLDEIAKQFGGSAVNATKSFDGQMLVLSERFADVRGTIGDALLPILQTLVENISTNLLPVIQALIMKFSNFISGLDWNSISATMSNLVTQVSSFISGIDWNGIIQSIMNLYNQVVNFGNTSGIFSSVTTLASSLAAMFSQVYTTFMETLANPEVQNYLNMLGEVLTVVANFALALANAIVSMLAPAFDYLAQGFIFVLDQIRPFYEYVFPIIMQVFTALTDMLNGDVSAGLNSFSELFTRIFNDIKTLVENIMSSITTYLSEFITSVVSTAESIGTAIMNGISSAITAGVTAVKNALAKSIGDSISFAKGILGIASPSKVFAKSVGMPIGQGIAMGISQSSLTISDALASAISPLATSTVTNNNYYLTANYSRTQSETSIMQDLQVIRQLSGGI